MEGELHLGTSMVSCSIDVVLVLDELGEYDILGQARQGHRKHWVASNRYLSNNTLA
jgi:hypothetical protein